MSWTPCPRCGWALEHREGSPCTNPDCASHATAPEQTQEDLYAAKERALKEAYEQRLATYNRMERRGNAVGRGRKVIPRGMPTEFAPSTETPEQRRAQDDQRRKIEDRDRTRRQQQRRNQKLARRKTRR